MLIIEMMFIHVFMHQLLLLVLLQQQEEEQPFHLEEITLLIQIPLTTITIKEAVILVIITTVVT